MATGTLTVDHHEYTPHDARATITNLAAWWAQLAEGRERPPGFDALVAEQATLLAHALHQPAEAGDPFAAVDRLGRRAYVAIGDGRLDAALVLGPSLRLVNEAVALLRAGGVLPATAAGELIRINVSAGGVPKQSVASATIDRGGVLGDRQAARRHHGRPWQALSLWSAEVVDGFAADGHPIAYGSCGENLTVRGLSWAEVRPGVRLAVGPVLVEASLFALPCAKNAQWFSDGDVSRIHHERGAVSRIYATVLEGGEVRSGDVVVLEP